jgi:phosphatidate cytidylyltransferase
MMADRRRLPRDLGPRVVVAVPAIAVLLVLNHVGGAFFAVPVALLGVLALRELTRMHGARPLVLAAGLVWIGGCLAHAVALRELDHGAGLVIDVLLAVFLGDTAAQLFGSAFGRRKLAPAISPNKTVEGLAAGLVVGTAACWAFATATQAWISGAEALALGLAAAIAAPVGDLLESAVKRRAGVKDSGRAFGAHGGVLDRIDAVMLAAVAGYWVASAAV